MTDEKRTNGNWSSSTRPTTDSNGPGKDAKITAADGLAEDDLEMPESEEPTEAYCVRCRHMVDMEDPEPVWTSKGTPGTRGTCPDCGTTVFRMGRTPAHERMVRPAAVKVEGNTKIAIGGGRRRAQPATYINYASTDLDFSPKIATNPGKAWIHTLGTSR